MRRTVLLVAAAFAAQGNNYAQTTFASITGLVTDPNGAVIVGALVTATKVDSNYQYTARSNNVGYYTLAQLREGEFVLRAESPGFKTFVQRGVQLVAQDLRRLDIRLEVGAVETTVEVKAGAFQIETEKARISDTKTAEVIKSLPLNTRSLNNYLGQTAGVLQAVSGTATRRFSGSRNNQSDASVDGITISNERDGTQISPLVSYVESFEEVRVDMANNTAEFGGLGQVTVISRSGTNILHGSGFDYYSTPMFFARNPFALQRNSNVTHNPGASIGGPVVAPHLYNGKDRTFFFFSFETNRGSQAKDILNPSVPLASWRQGDFSGLLPSTVVKDPFANAAPFAGNIIPTSRINPVAQKLQTLFYPLPNFGNPNVFQSQNFRTVAVRPFDPSTYWTTRLDHRFSDKSFLFGRFTWSRSYGRPWDDNLPTIGRIDQTRENQGANVSFSRTIRPNLLNEVRWGFAYNDQPRNGAQLGKQLVDQLGLQGLAPNLPDIQGIPQLNWTGLGITNLTQQVWRRPGFKNKVFQFQDQLSWFHGRHTIKAGAIMDRVRYADGSVPNNLFGNVTFSNRFTGYPYSDFLLGIPTTSARSFPNFVVQELRWALSAFVTDEFKIAPSLTLDLGLRYELHPPAKNTDGLNSIFDITTGKIVVPDGSLDKVSALLPKNYVGVIGASTVGLPAALEHTDANNIAPRVGLAWRPMGPNTVLRLGFGVFFDVVPTTASSGGSPYVIDQPAFTNPTPTPTVILPLVFPGNAAGPTSITLPTALNPNLRTPYSMQYNATIEHQRGNTAVRLSYIGTNTRKGEYNYNINQPLPSTALYVNKPRLFPAYPNFNYLTNGAGHQYNAMTAEVKRRGAGGLSYQFSYTLARDIGDLERGESPENAYDRGRERAVWLDIPTHRVSSNLIWDVPVGRGKRFLSGANRWMNLVAGGWSLSAIYTYHSGHFLTPLWTGADPTGTAFTSSTTPANVTIRPNILRDPNLPYDQRTVSRWFDAAAFSGPTAGSYGTSAKGVIKGPHVTVLDTGIFKAFPIKERLMVRWELTAVNLFNHPNYADPAVNISSAGQVGVISGVDGISALDPSGARAFRMGLRIEF